MLWVTASNPRDLLGGPIDWLVTLAIWIAGAFGTTVFLYVMQSLRSVRVSAVQAQRDSVRTFKAAE